ncbi:MAG: precorrin-8X methylmutase [Ruminiclostridium sp.]|nr:precorrin-8X methylmutase [Ruminiclostridium sp.]
MSFENIRPADIEKRSMEIIESEIGDTSMFSPQEKLIVKRCIHTTADFDYKKNLRFSEGAADKGIAALRSGAVIVTDTQMALSGISKPACKALGCEVHCFMSDADVAGKAKELGVTRAVVSVDKAAELFADRTMIYAVGNAPTALIRLHGLIAEKKISPALIIGVPVGFVNVVEAKELIMTAGVPYIVAAGRKGGSNVAAAIVNAMLYTIYERS